MQIVLSDTGSELRVSLHGPLDAVSVARDRDAAERIVDAAGDAIVISMTGVGFIDASGLGFLAHLAKRAANKGAALKLENLRGQPFDFLSHLGLDEAFGFSRPTVKTIPVATTFQKAA